MSAVETPTEKPELVAAKQKADAENKTRSGKGTRVRVGQTRGKASMVVSWEAFDEAQPDTLPTTVAEFMELTGKKETKDIVEMLIAGFNDASYTAASDPIAEFVNPTWPEDVQAQFRLVVRNYARATNGTIEAAVALIKPGIDAQYSASGAKQ